MEQLIPITGFANTYEELCTKVAQPGEYFNVLEPKPFMTYHKLDGIELGNTNKTTDVSGWFKNKAELESNIRPTEGEIWITGECAPYTRWKAEYVDYILTFVEDGEEEKKIIKNYKTINRFGMAHLEPEEGIYYSVGKELPFALYGVVSSWEPVGTFISYIADSVEKLYYPYTQPKPLTGQIAYVKGMYYLCDGDKWNPIDIPEPIENVYKHVFEAKDKQLYRLREGRQPGTLEYFQPKE